MKYDAQTILLAVFLICTSLALVDFMALFNVLALLSGLLLAAWLLLDEFGLL